MNKKTTILISKFIQVSGSFNCYQTLQPLKDANLECLKKSPQEPGTSNLEISKYASNKTKDADYFFHGILYPINGLCCTALLLFW